MKSTQKHVLLCDGDEFLLSIYKKKFEALGYKVTLARSAESCFKEAEKKHPGVIVMDPLISGGTGFEAIEILKKTQKTRNIPVVVYTQIGEKQDIKRVHELGAFAYLIKSHADAADLLEMVQEVFDYQTKREK